ncbi:hypothetical protein [uncultured phage cr49_1]|uniref:Uncharacterized protein n=1 Tax=uncultured phage cr49_1 TaxID=2986402 RepID=A0AAE7RTF8_9CAUD|nr:hypothetical protein M1M42_gp13 [uncultured phage cr49_1]QWM89074.1 hypothetical protein [uncultured phage cr49_1]
MDLFVNDFVDFLIDLFIKKSINIYAPIVGYLFANDFVANFNDFAIDFPINFTIDFLIYIKYITVIS